MEDLLKLAGTPPGHGKAVQALLAPYVSYTKDNEGNSVLRLNEKAEKLLTDPRDASQDSPPPFARPAAPSPHSAHDYKQNLSPRAREFLTAASPRMQRYVDRIMQTLDDHPYGLTPNKLFFHLVRSEYKNTERPRKRRAALRIVREIVTTGTREKDGVTIWFHPCHQSNSPGTPSMDFDGNNDDEVSVLSLEDDDNNDEADTRTPSKLEGGTGRVSG